MRKLPWFLLAISLALNVFFIGGAIYTEYAAEHADPTARRDLLTEELFLTAAQQDSLTELRNNLQDRRQLFRDYMDPVRSAMADELAKDQFDREAFRVVMEQRRDVRDEYFLQLAEELHGFVQVLEPEQKATFLDLIREKGFFRVLRPWRRPR